MNIAHKPPATLSPVTIARFAAIVGDKYAITAEADVHPYVTEDRNLFRGTSPLVLRPGAFAMRVASQFRNSCGFGQLIVTRVASQLTRASDVPVLRPRTCAS